MINGYFEDSIAMFAPAKQASQSLSRF